MAQLDPGPSIGIALGGGGAAALAEIGVLEVFEEAGIRISAVAGTSAGAVVGAAYAAGRLSLLRDAVSKLTRRRALWLFNPGWPRAGLFAAHSSMEFLRPFVGEQIEDLPLPFGAVAADLETGEDVVLRSGPTIEALRASIAIPGLFEPCRVDGRWLVDGAIVNPLPVNVARSLDAEFVIAVNVLPLGDRTHGAFHAAYRDLRSSRMARWLRRLAQRRGETLGIEEAIDGTNGDVPMHFSAVISQASRIVTARIAAARLHDESPDYLLTVPLADVGVFDFGGTSTAIARGREVALQALDDIQAEIARASTAFRLRRLGRWWPGRSPATTITPPAPSAPLESPTQTGV